MSKCNQHDNSKMEFFCTQCCTLACSECIRESHNQHNQYVLNLPDFLQNISHQCEELLKSLCSLMDQIQNSFEQLGKAISHKYIIQKDQFFQLSQDQVRRAIESLKSFEEFKNNIMLTGIFAEFEAQINILRDKYDLIDPNDQFMQGYTYKFCFQNPFKFQYKQMTTENPQLNLINGYHNPFHVDPQQINSIKQNLQSLINLKNSYKKNLIINQEQAQQIQKYEEKVQWTIEELKRLST